MDTVPATAPWGGFSAETTAALRVAVIPHLDDLAAELTALYRHSIPVYERFDPAAITRNTRMLLELVTDRLGSESPALTTQGVVDFARDLAEQGTPLEPVAHSIQLGARHVVRLVRGPASELGISDDELAAMQDAAWQWATDCAAVIHSVQREVAVAGATRRADFVRRLVAGDLSSADLAEQAPQHRLSPERTYRVACLVPPVNGSMSDAATALRVHGGAAAAPAVDAAVGDLLVMLLPTHPEQVRLSDPVGLGPDLPLAQAQASYDQARQALAIARAHDMRGLLGLADLGPLPLVGAADDAADLLDEQHLTPLRALGATGRDVLATVTTYLAHDRRVDETALALHLHRNSVRYRLTRFTEVTGLDLDRTDDFVLAWWLLRREQVAR